METVHYEHLPNLIFAAIILILFSMFFSASESAFLSVNKLRIRFLRNKKKRAAKTAGKLLDGKEKLLNTILVANNIVNIALTALLTTISYELWGSAGVGIAAIFATLLLLIFGEITPKTIATRHAESIAFIAAPFIHVLEIILCPLVFFFTVTARFFSFLFGIRFEKPEKSFTEEEIKTFLEFGEESGVLEHDEKHMMHKVFKFTDLAAKDIMIPRTQMRAISQNSTYREIIELSQKSHTSRFPVLDKNDDIDNIQGILYMKDMLSKDEKNFSVKKDMRKPLFILETKKMTTVQQLLREKNQSIAIILDEYSGTSGLLTKEDITKEIFGSIGDEYDIPLKKEQQPPLTKNDRLIKGSTRLLDLEEALNTTISSEFHETIGGFIMEKLDKLPTEGDFILHDGWRFTVNLMSKNKIKQIYMEKLS